MVHQPPEIMVHGLVTPEDVDNLFKMYANNLCLVLFLTRPYRFYEKLNVRALHLPSLPLYLITSFVQPFLSVLDPKLHTPASTFSRCPFLFTVICAVSSRYYALKSSIYPIAMHFAKQAAAKNLIDGWKCVEQCQAYLLMSTYAQPARKWEDDRSWIYLGEFFLWD